MFIIRTLEINDLKQSKNLVNLEYNLKLNQLVQIDKDKESILYLPSINPLWINYFEGFEINPSEESLIICVWQGDNFYKFIPELEQWEISPNKEYYHLDYFREILKFWRGKLDIEIKFLIDQRKKTIKEIKVGYWVTGNHIDFLSEFGIAKYTSFEVKSHRIVPTLSATTATIPKDISISRVNKVKYQDFKNQKPEKLGRLNKEEGIIEFYESISSSYIRLLFFLDIKSQFIYEFEQISETPCVSILLKEGENYITNGIVESIRIDNSIDRYIHYNYFYNQPFEISVTCQSQRDLREYTNQILNKIYKNNPIYIPTHDFYLGFFISKKPVYLQSVDNITDNSLYSSIFEITFKFVPDVQEINDKERINYFDVSFESQRKQIKQEKLDEYITPFKNRNNLLIGVIPDQLDHTYIRVYNNNSINQIGLIPMLKNNECCVLDNICLVDDNFTLGDC